MLVSICRGKGLLGIGGQEVEDKALPKPTQGSRGATSGTRAMAAESRHTEPRGSLASSDAIAELICDADDNWLFRGAKCMGHGRDANGKSR